MRVCLTTRLRVPGRSRPTPYGNLEGTSQSFHYPDSAGKGASGVRVPKGLVNGQGGTCQQVTEAPHCRLQLGRGSRVTSHVLLVEEAQEPQLLHPALGTDRPTDLQRDWLRRPASGALLPASGLRPASALLNFRGPEER